MLGYDTALPRSVRRGLLLKARVNQDDDTPHFEHLSVEVAKMTPAVPEGPQYRTPG